MTYSCSTHLSVRLSSNDVGQKSALEMNKIDIYISPMETASFHNDRHLAF